MANQMKPDVLHVDGEADIFVGDDCGPSHQVNLRVPCGLYDKIAAMPAATMVGIQHWFKQAALEKLEKEQCSYPPKS